MNLPEKKLQHSPMYSRKLSVLICLALCSLSAQAELYLHTNLKCVSTVERREIHIYQNSAEPPNGPACRLDYLKQEETTTLWTAQNNAKFCVSKANELVDRLESANFKCVSTLTFDREAEQYK